MLVIAGGSHDTLMEVFVSAMANRVSTEPGVPSVVCVWYVEGRGRREKNTSITQHFQQVIPGHRLQSGVTGYRQDYPPVPHTATPIILLSVLAFETRH